MAARTIEKMKILGAVLELPSKQHCQSSPFTSKLGQIGSAVYLVTRKWLQGFWFFQMQWMPIIHFMWKPLRHMRAHFWHYLTLFEILKYSIYRHCAELERVFDRSLVEVVQGIASSSSNFLCACLLKFQSILSSYGLEQVEKK